MPDVLKPGLDLRFNRSGRFFSVGHVVNAYIQSGGNIWARQPFDPTDRNEDHHLELLEDRGRGFEMEAQGNSIALASEKFSFTESVGATTGAEKGRIDRLGDLPFVEIPEDTLAVTFEARELLFDLSSGPSSSSAFLSLAASAELENEISHKESKTLTLVEARELALSTLKDLEDKWEAYAKEEAKLLSAFDDEDDE